MVKLKNVSNNKRLIVDLGGCTYMKATVEKISSNKVKISFEIEAAKFDEGLDAAYRKNVKRINITGFRKGKAPLKVI